MADQSNSDASGAFTRAFLPGLILGLVVGGLAGAFLPDILGSKSLSPIERDPNATPQSREGEGASLLTPEQQDALDQAREDAEGMVDDATEAAEGVIDDVTEAGEEAVDDAAGAVNDAIDGLTGDDQP